MDDLISRQTVFDTITEYRNQLRDIFGEENELIRVVDIVKHRLIALPSAPPDVPDTNVGDLISREARGDALNRMRVGNNETWYSFYQKALDELCKLPSAQPDLSGYSDRLWKAAYERGKAEAQPEIIHCGECKYYDDSDGCFFSTATTGADGFCHWAERKEGETDEAN